MEERLTNEQFLNYLHIAQEMQYKLIEAGIGKSVFLNYFHINDVNDYLGNVESVDLDIIMPEDVPNIGWRVADYHTTEECDELIKNFIAEVKSQFGIDL